MTCSHKHLVLLDSGIGGLTTLQLIAKHFTNLEFTYIADKRYYPYTQKTDQQLKERLQQLVSHIAAVYMPDVIVIACNTAATLALPDLQRHVAVPVVGVYPALERAAAVTQSNRIALLATPATLERDLIQQGIAKIAADMGVRTCQLGSVELIELAEQKLSVGKVSRTAIARIFKPLFTESDQCQTLSKPIDVVILGCTHFPWLNEEFELVAKQYKQNIYWLDSNLLVIDDLIRIIPEHISAEAQQPELLYKTFFVTCDKTDLLAAASVVSSTLAKNLITMGFTEIKELLL